MGVEEVIVVADDGIGEEAGVQAHLKGTDHVPGCIGLDGPSVEALLPVQHVEHGIVHPVVMSLCVGAEVRVALGLLHEANLLLGGEDDALQPQPLAPQDVYGLLRHCPGDGLGSQVEELLPHPLPHGLDGRVDGGDGLAHSRGGFQEEFLLMINRPVHMGRQFPLPLPVGEGELQPPDGIPADAPPLPGIVRPFPVGGKQSIEPFRQAVKSVLLVEISNLPGGHVAIGQAHAHPLQPLARTVQIGVALGLGHVQRQGGLQPGDVSVGPLNLVDGDLAVLMDDAVRPPLHAEHVAIGGKCHLQRHLGLVFRAHPALDHAVDAAALLHGVIRRYVAAVVDVPVAQDEFHQPAHGYAHLLQGFRSFG